MDPAQLFQQYRELQQYVGWTNEDAARVRRLSVVAQPHLRDLVDDFYAEIDRHPEAKKVITGGPAQVERLKATLIGWLGELLSGNYDANYVVRRWRVGYRHVEIGLDQVYTNVALSRLRTGLVNLVQDAWHSGWPGFPAAGETVENLAASVCSLNKLLDLDLAIIEGAYRTEDTLRREQAERRVQSERLAAIGEMVAGLQHESRNAFQRSQACLELLALEVADRPEAIDLVTRIQKAQDHLHHLYEEVRGYAAPIKLHREPCDLRGIWQETWSHILETNTKTARLRDDSRGVDLTCDVDRHAVAQLFRNILENCVAATENPVEVVIRCTPSVRDGAPALSVSVRDNGPGFSDEQLTKVFEPFFTTKTQGTGLGMAIAKRIVETHEGLIRAGNHPAGGAEIVFVLPRHAV